MKKIIFIVIGIVILIIFLLWNFGLEIGNVRIGKQVDLQTQQLGDFEESSFAKDYYNSDDLTILNVWATWCIPCIEEMPDLNKIKKKYDSNNINFLSISVDKDSLKLINFLKKDKFNFKDITLENLAYRSAILNKLEGRPTDKHIYSYTVPLTYMIKNGKLLKKFKGTTNMAELKSIISRYK